MANLLDIRRRIKSVKNTQQITKAMKMVSAAKLKRAQNRVVSARPFATKMQEVLGELSAHTDENFHHPLMDKRGDSRYLVVLITADKGLCGAFNTNLLKAATAFINENEGKQIEMIPVGRRGRDYFKRRGMHFLAEYVGITSSGRISFAEAQEMAREIVKIYMEDEKIDKVFIIYNEFKSVMQQKVALEQLLPVAKTEAKEEEVSTDATKPVVFTEYIYEQPVVDIFATLLPQLVETKVYRALLESIASEQGARMTAMDSASKNAGDLIGSLTLNMNRIRQAKITNEIIEVVSGGLNA